MSLINDALKKAQKQRTGDVPSLASMPSIGGERAARIAKRGKPAGFNTLLLRLGLGAGGLLVLVIGGGVLLRSAKKPAIPAASPQVAAVGSAPVQPGSSPSSTPPPAPAATAFSLPIAVPAPPAPEPAPAASAPAPAPARQAPVVVATKSLPAVSEAKPVASSPAPQASPAAPPAKMGGKEINFIEALRIAGIRASATDSKVLMNDRVYRTGDIVEHELGLKLVGITSSSLTFESENGARYTRTF